MHCVVRLAFLQPMSCTHYDNEAERLVFFMAKPGHINVLFLLIKTTLALNLRYIKGYVSKKSAPACQITRQAKACEKNTFVIDHFNLYGRQKRNFGFSSHITFKV